MARAEDGEDREEHHEAEEGIRERGADARGRQELQRHADLLDQRSVREDRRRSGLQRRREERPGQEADEEEDGVRLLSRRRDRPSAQHHAEQDPEHDELQQRVDEVPHEAERRALVPGAELAPREVDEQLAALDEHAQVGDHGGRVFRVMPARGALVRNGTELVYWTWPGAAPPTLLLHGIGNYGRYWDLFADAIAGRLGLIAPDARGHGESGRPADGYAPADFAADALAILDRLRLDPRGGHG